VAHCLKRRFTASSREHLKVQDKRLCLVATRTTFVGHETYPLMRRHSSATKLCIKSTIPSLATEGHPGAWESACRLLSPQTRFRCRRSYTAFLLLTSRWRESISFPQLATLLSATRERLFARCATHRLRPSLSLCPSRRSWSGVYRFGPVAASVERINTRPRLLAAALSFGDKTTESCVACSMIGDLLRMSCQRRRSRRSLVACRAGSIGPPNVSRCRGSWTGGNRHRSIF